uniref:Methenyltetrahydrofolate cyclohydrolase n=1 Tax=Chromera velia CCMP2878 TaxID=1169474 RepID=A0A0G4GDZ3_9ALVE|eukprot:Cvel_21465.t1-p1 / transcript=Cvel_21465.t1 / gene=Cvel_21465 / organism=Chromera_velia_CCMP2878 / gene_product=Bifunctional protein FolD, putative / transcript_product=Bifunctional protein FolD, putative / location=Cvel_scaffold2015:20060-24900(+) / protein_length=944 / sequence_SO=supercontig / SO=protein_coding / is_pseudo=false
MSVGEKAKFVKNGNVLDGSSIAKAIRSETKEAVQHLTRKHLRPPCLVIFLVGSREDSATYVKHKKKTCEECGILCEIVRLGDDVSLQELTHAIEERCRSPFVDAMLVQMPLPPALQSHTNKVMSLICPPKEIDGLHPLNISALTGTWTPYSSFPGTTRGEMGTKLLDPLSRLLPVPSSMLPFFVPVGAEAALEMLWRAGLGPSELSEKTVVILGDSNLIARPLSLCLSALGTCVTVVPSRGCMEAEREERERQSNCRLETEKRGDDGLILPCQSWGGPSSVSFSSERWLEKIRRLCRKADVICAACDIPNFVNNEMLGGVVGMGDEVKEEEEGSDSTRRLPVLLDLGMNFLEVDLECMLHSRMHPSEPSQTEAEKQRERDIRSTPFPPSSPLLSDFEISSLCKALMAESRECAGAATAASASSPNLTSQAAPPLPSRKHSLKAPLAPLHEHERPAQADRPLTSNGPGPSSSCDNSRPRPHGLSLGTQPQSPSCPSRLCEGLVIPPFSASPLPLTEHERKEACDWARVEETGKGKGAGEEQMGNEGGGAGDQLGAWQVQQTGMCSSRSASPSPAPMAILRRYSRSNDGRHSFSYTLFDRRVSGGFWRRSREADAEYLRAESGGRSGFVGEMEIVQGTSSRVPSSSVSFFSSESVSISACSSARAPLVSRQNPRLRQQQDEAAANWSPMGGNGEGDGEKEGFQETQTEGAGGGGRNVTTLAGRCSEDSSRPVSVSGEEWIETSGAWYMGGCASLPESPSETSLKSAKKDSNNATADDTAGLRRRLSTSATAVSVNERENSNLNAGGGLEGERSPPSGANGEGGTGTRTPQASSVPSPFNTATTVEGPPCTQNAPALLASPISSTAGAGAPAAIVSLPSGISVPPGGLAVERRTSHSHTVVGDVAFSQVKPLCKLISPVPGGAGPVTIALLARNVLRARWRSLGLLR